MSIPRPQPDQPQPPRPEHDAAVRILQTLRGHGHTAYLAGGCVRDILLGEEPKDYDVATDARPEQIAEYFKKTASVGAAFGVMLVRDFGPAIEVASFRSDGVYSDTRRPDTIEFSSPREDARRRDFTINALFMDPLSEEPNEVIDYVCGLADIRDRVLRAVGDPADRLREDHLRALRAVRFAARYELTIEQRTKDAIKDHALELAGVSIERIGEEIKRMLTHPSRERACELIDELGLDDAIFADSAAFDNTIMNLLDTRVPYPAALVALALGRGHGFMDAPGPICNHYRKCLDLSNADRDAMRTILEIMRCYHGDWGSLSVAAKKRLAGREHADMALLVYGAICGKSKSDRAATIIEEVMELAEKHGGINPEPLISGGDLIEQGLEPGPRFKGILDDVYDAQLEGRVKDKGQALSMAADLVRQESRSRAGK
ncbi:MAG: CCA tRNA nucleotidyltransferase [Phycisphaerales bacterium]